MCARTPGRQPPEVWPVGFPNLERFGVSECPGASTGSHWEEAQKAPNIERLGVRGVPGESTASHREGAQKTPNIERRRVATGANHPASHSSALRRGPGTPAIGTPAGDQSTVMHVTPNRPLVRQDRIRRQSRHPVLQVLHCRPTMVTDLYTHPRKMPRRSGIAGFILPRGATGVPIS